MNSNVYLMITFLMVAFTPELHAQTAPPPQFGEDTRGEPAALENLDADQTTSLTNEKAASRRNSDELAGKESKSLTNNLLGEATIKESRRENGQVYRIELEHSAGSKQYIEENDSDGVLSSDDINLENTPNLPKWKLGSW